MTGVALIVTATGRRYSARGRLALMLEELVALLEEGEVPRHCTISLRLQDEKIVASCERRRPSVNARDYRVDHHAA